MNVLQAEGSDREAARLRALYDYQILDTESEVAFDDLTQLAAQICNTPIALISLVDKQRQWFKSKVGLTVSETHRDIAFCTHAILRDELLIVSDVLSDQRFSSNPLVTGDPRIRFYAGAPLITPEGYRIGTLCVIDQMPRRLHTEQLEALRALSRQVISQLELRRSYVTLQERENRLQAIIDTEPECVKLIDANGRLLEMNPAGLAMIEADNIDAVAGQSVYPMITPEYRSTFQAFNERICQGDRGTLEYEIVGLQGTRRYVESHAVPLSIHSNGTFAQLAVTRDITARKQTEEALRQQAERERVQMAIAQRIRQSLDLNEILNTTVAEVRQYLQVDRVLIYRFEPDWSGIIAVESVDSHWLSILGRQIHDCCFQNSTQRAFYEQGHIQATEDVYSAGLAPCYTNLLAQFQVRSNLVVPILQQDRLWGLLIAHHCSESRQWQSLEIDLLKQLATQAAIAIHQADLYRQVQTELSERIQAEHKIRDQAALLDVATNAIFVHDLNYQITYWNRGAERLYGWSPADACGKLVTRLLYQETPDSLSEAYQVLFKKGYWQGELRHFTQSEKEIVVESRWTLVDGLGGQPSTILVVNTDITQKKQLEQQFLRTQRMESIGTLAGGIAHDLNNVLAPILMAVQLLEMQIQDSDDPRNRQWLDIIESSARRGANLVKQVLSFAQGTRGERSLLEIKHLIWEIKKIADETFPKSITFSTNLPRNLWTVYGDATQLHQILMNLCVNARDAMPNGGVLEVMAQNTELGESEARQHWGAETGSYVMIQVSDSGTGIPAAIVDRIFDPFFTTKDIGKGTGLGLSTVMSIVKSHGGFLTLSSKVGYGTKFQVYLPALQSEEKLEQENLEMPKGKGEWILVADDEVAIQQVTKNTLETHGYHVMTANNGIEAIALYTRYQANIRLALIDLIMPAMDGATTIRTLQAINPQLKIVATSGLSTSNGWPEMQLQTDRLLAKPFTAQDLLIALHQILNA